MKSVLKILLVHLLVFSFGSAAIAIYLYFRFPAFVEQTGLGGIVVGPVIMLLYIILFGLLCAASFAISCVVVFIRRRLKRKNKKNAS